MSEGKDRPREAISQRPRAGGTRCPFCHEECQADGDACACAECLSRHHRGCWDEGGACASCKGARRLEAPARVDPRGYEAAIEVWLRLGLLYNAGLALVTIVCLRAALLRFAGDLVLGALLANVCFLLGPAIELTARRFGYQGRLLRPILFWSGSALAALLALVCCVEALPGP